MVEKGYSPIDASREIKEAVGRTFRNLDVTPSFRTFCYHVVSNRMANNNDDSLSKALKWLSGEKLERHEKQNTWLFETLQKSNARSWLNALIKIMRKAGMAGLVVIIDDIERMTEQIPDTKRYYYTSNNVKDTCELLRQLIDDVELLSGLLLLLSGRREIVEDEKRGFKSYEALWMRLQSGLVANDCFNICSDIVDIDAYVASQDPDFPKQVADRLQQLLKAGGWQRKFKVLPEFKASNELRLRVMETAFLAERSE